MIVDIFENVINGNISDAKKGIVAAIQELGPHNFIIDVERTTLYHDEEKEAVKNYAIVALANELGL